MELVDTYFSRLYADVIEDDVDDIIDITSSRLTPPFTRSNDEITKPLQHEPNTASRPRTGSWNLSAASSRLGRRNVTTLSENSIFGKYDIIRTANGAGHNQSAAGAKAPPFTATSNGEAAATGANNRQQQTQNPDGSANDSWSTDAEASNTVEIAVGKKGGTFPLPFGGQLTVAADAFTKRAVITCTQVLPQDRYQFEPTLSNDERLTSEIYVIDTHGRSFKRPIGLQLSYYPVNRDVTDIGVLWKPSNSSFWQSTESNPGTNNVVNFIMSGDGAFVVISYPHCERFDIPAVGCLYSARLHRQISVRCPKGAVNNDIQCDIQILPLKPIGLTSPSAQVDIASATDYFRFTTSVDGIEFRRNLTVKLPLPALPSADGDQVTADDIAVCQSVTSPQNGGTSWIVVDGPLKLTKTSVSFETKTLSKYCVVLVKPAGAARALLPRGARLADTLNKIEADNDKPRGEFLPFIQLSAKQWTLWIDCVRKDLVQQAVDARSEMTLVKPSSLQLPVTSSFGQRGSTVGSRFKRKDSGASGNGSFNGGGSGESELRLTSSCSFSLEVAGDVELSDPNGCEEITNTRITYHDTFLNNCRQFSIIPKPTSVSNGPKVLTCVLRLHPYDSGDISYDHANYAVRCFDFDIPQEVVEDYLYVEPEPEVVAPPNGHGHVRESLAEMMASLQTQPVVAPVAQPTVIRRDPKEVAEIFNRLTRATRAPTLVPKEPRVLSGKSLQCLARAMPAGINLAVHLDISDSTITGMAFDALANGLNSSDITYRILLLWKRRWAASTVGGGYRTNQDVGSVQVDTLAAAANAIGQAHIAEVILDRHRVNKELTSDCFALTTDDVIEQNEQYRSYEEIVD